MGSSASSSTATTSSGLCGTRRSRTGTACSPLRADNKTTSANHPIVSIAMEEKRTHSSATSPSYPGERRTLPGTIGRHGFTTRCCRTVERVQCVQHSSPYVYPGTELTHFTENIDIFPTIAEALGHPVPAQCDGSALGPLLRGQHVPHWRTAATYARTHAASLTTHWPFFRFAFGPTEFGGRSCGAQHGRPPACV